MCIRDSAKSLRKTCHDKQMALEITAARPDPALLDLPWSVPLEGPLLARHRPREVERCRVRSRRGDLECHLLIVARLPDPEVGPVGSWKAQKVAAPARDAATFGCV